jgi:hypothetical protein
MSEEEIQAKLAEKVKEAQKAVIAPTKAQKQLDKAKHGTEPQQKANATATANPKAKVELSAKANAKAKAKAVPAPEVKKKKKSAR